MSPCWVNSPKPVVMTAPSRPLNSICIPALANRPPLFTCARWCSEAHDHATGVNRHTSAAIGSIALTALGHTTSATPAKPRVTASHASGRIGSVRSDSSASQTGIGACSTAPTPLGMYCSDQAVSTFAAPAISRPASNNEGNCSRRTKRSPRNRAIARHSRPAVRKRTVASPNGVKSTNAHLCASQVEPQISEHAAKASQGSIGPERWGCRSKSAVRGDDKGGARGVDRGTRRAERGLVGGALRPRFATPSSTAAMLRPSSPLEPALRPWLCLRLNRVSPLKSVPAVNR